MKFIIELFSSFFYVGYLPIRGTLATIVALPLVEYLSTKNMLFNLVFITMLIICSTIISSLAEEMFNKKDDERIVIDEICGFIVAMLGIKITNFVIIFIGFILFRLFDTSKVGFKKIQNLPSGIGIMFDDIISGIVTNFILRMIILPYITKLL